MTQYSRDERTRSLNGRDQWQTIRICCETENSIEDQDISSSTKTKAELENERKLFEIEQKNKEQLDGEHQRLRVQMELGQQRKQQLIQQRDS